MLAAVAPPFFGGADRLFLIRVDLDQPVEKFAALEQRPDVDLFVEAVNASQVRPQEYWPETRSLNADAIGEFAVRCTCSRVAPAAVNPPPHGDRVSGDCENVFPSVASHLPAGSDQTFKLQNAGLAIRVV